MIANIDSIKIEYISSLSKKVRIKDMCSLFRNEVGTVIAENGSLLKIKMDKDGTCTWRPVSQLCEIENGIIEI